MNNYQMYRYVFGIVNELFFVFSTLDCSFKLQYVIKEMQKLMSICKQEGSTKKENIKGKGLKNIPSN